MPIGDGDKLLNLGVAKSAYCLPSARNVILLAGKVRDGLDYLVLESEFAPMDRVCHFEVPYDEKERMEKFYSTVFGWQFSDVPGEMPYTFAITTEMDESFQIKKPGGINGGTYPRGDEGPHSRSPLIVMEVENCEAKMKMIEEAGGTNLIGPHQVGDMGIYAQVKGTEDNIIGLWQPLGG